MDDVLDVSSDEPSTPKFVYNDEFINVGENDEFGSVEEDDDLDGEDINENEDNVECENLYENVDASGKFFRAYALQNGFDIKIQSPKGVLKVVKYGRLYGCRLAGKSGESSSSKRRREILPRCDCKVRMYVNYSKNLSLWEITSLELNHNHLLATPTKMKLIQREKHVNTATRSLIKTLHGSEIRDFEVMNVICNIHEGSDKVGFDSQHVRNVMRDDREKRFEKGDVQTALDLLHRFNEESGSKFFIRTQVDEYQRLKCLVWVDPRCLMAYQNFGDVVAFDTTYRINQPGREEARDICHAICPFYGINHHYQSMIFGFALMRDEHTTTFDWVLSIWLEAVGNKHPMTIITDQDQAMENSIASVHPNSTHLLCSWHISNKFPEKLAHYYLTFPDFKVDFNHCIYNSLTEDYFEARCESLVEKYELQENKWLQGLYELKEKLIIAYTRITFSMGQNTTSRIEGMNSFFDSYVSSAMGLKEFIENAQKALSRQFVWEKEEDFVTCTLKRPMKLHITLEIHGSKIYTKEMFRKFQDEFVESLQYFVVKDKKTCEEGEKEGDGNTYYCLYRQNLGPTSKLNYVSFDKEALTWMCMCRMVEHLGIPC